MEAAMSHWRTFLDSDVIRFVDLNGMDHVVQIKTVKRGKVKGTGGKESGKAMVHLEGRAKPLGCGAETLTQISDALGSTNTKEWAGKWVVLWPDPTVKYGGAAVGGVRVRRKLPDEAMIASAIQQLAEMKAAQEKADKEAAAQAKGGSRG
jgi:hypothetical protein